MAAILNIAQLQKILNMPKVVSSWFFMSRVYSTRICKKTSVISQNEVMCHILQTGHVKGTFTYSTLEAKNVQHMSHTGSIEGTCTYLWSKPFHIYAPYWSYWGGRLSHTLEAKHVQHMHHSGHIEGIFAYLRSQTWSTYAPYWTC